jgi:hypothetical protein
MRRPAIAEPIAEPITKPVAEPITKPIAKPIAKPVAEPPTPARKGPRGHWCIHWVSAVLCEPHRRLDVDLGEESV